MSQQIDTAQDAERRRQAAEAHLDELSDAMAAMRMKIARAPYSPEARLLKAESWPLGRQISLAKRELAEANRQTLSAPSAPPSRDWLDYTVRVHRKPSGAYHLQFFSQVGRRLTELGAVQDDMTWAEAMEEAAGYFEDMKGETEAGHNE